MRNLLVALLMLFAGFGQTQTVRVSGFQGLPQQMSNWCWAASIQSIFLTRGLDVSQARIVTAAYGSPQNTTAPGFNGTLNILNGLSVSADGSFWQIRASAGNSFPDADWLLRKLEHDEPVMVWFRDPNTNHSIIVNGGRYNRNNAGNVQWQQIYAYDPWLNQTMTIDASNIPRFVYGTFDIQLRRSQVQVGGVCHVPAGRCPLAQPLPVGSRCFCPSQFGPVYGVVGS